MSATMASALPYLSPPVLGPPTSALPPIPTANKPPRKSLPVPTGPSKIITDLQNPPKLRSPSSPRPSALPTTQQSLSTPNLPTLRSSSSLSKSTLPEKTVRKTISINSFPHPPVAGSRPGTATSTHTAPPSSKTRASDVNGQAMSGTTRAKRPPRASAASSITSYRGSETPSLLNGAGSGKSIPIIGSHRSSTGQASTSSPPQSRSSSAEGSYSTSATTFEDTEETTRGRSRDGADNMPESNRNSRN